MKRATFLLPIGRSRKSLFSLLLALPVAMEAQTYTNDYGIWRYTVNNGAITIAGYEGSVGKVTIPGTIDDLPVTSIGHGVFYKCYYETNFTIPYTVTSIGDYAFFDCPRPMVIFFNGNAPSLGTDVFGGGTRATVYYLPGTTGWTWTFGGASTALWLLPNPLILNHSPGIGVHTNGFGFIISWATNVSLVVEASASLSIPAWSPVGTNALIEGWSYFSDPQWSNYTRRFYRIRLP
jgi:hypothetical protein